MRDETRARHELRRLALVVVDRRHRDHVALIAMPPDEHTAIERLDSLGVGDAGVEAARDVHGDVVAAEREAVGVHEVAAGEHRQRGGAGAHVDHGGAEIGLVVGQHRQGRRHRASPPWPRRRDGSARSRASGCAPPRRRRSSRCMSTPKRRAEHAARIADAALAVERIADRQRMQHGAARRAPNGWLPAASTRAMSRSDTDGPATSTDAAKSSLPRRPADTDTMTDSNCTPGHRARRDRPHGGPPSRPRRGRPRRRP